MQSTRVKNSFDVKKGTNNRLDNSKHKPKALRQWKASFNLMRQRLKEGI